MEHEHIDTPPKSTQFSWPTSSSVGGKMQVVEIQEASNTNLTETKVETNDKDTGITPVPAEVTVRRQPTNLFDSKEQYLAFKAQWAKLATDKKLTSTMMLFYNLVRGKRFKRGFTSVTNKIKLANGHKPEAAYSSALASVRYFCIPKNAYAEKERTEMLTMFNINDEFMTKVSNYLNGPDAELGRGGNRIV